MRAATAAPPWRAIIRRMACPRDTIRITRTAARALCGLLPPLLAAACANPYDPAQRAVGGGLIGAGTGALLGGLAGGQRGAAVGAVAGGLSGAAIGAATTPPPPSHPGGFGAGQVQYPPNAYAPPPAYAPAQAPAPVGAWTHYPSPGPAYVAAPYPQPPPPPPAWQPPPGSYWQPQPYYPAPDLGPYYRY